jgi:hypothetical protein
MQRGHGIAQFGHAAGAQARIERHRRHRVVAPGVAQPQRRQVPLVDPRHDRHQFHRADVQLLQVGEHGGMGQRRPAQRLRHIGVQHGEGAHVHFVDQPAAREARGFVRAGRERAGNDRLGHERRRVHAELRQAGS